MNKRDFIRSAAAIVGATAVSPLMASGNINARSSVAAAVNAQGQTPGNPVLKKGLVFGMIKEGLPLADKFKVARDAGFDGIELNTPAEFGIDEILEAKEKAGIELPSVINRDHWKMPLSDPDPKVREACIESVAKSLEEVKLLGGDTVLVVPGVVNEKVPYEQAYNTSMESIRKLIPHAERTGMQIALENVWNNFILSPVEARRFVDEINHPLVGWYFDIGNILRYGWPEHWIRTLNRRIMKLHIKEYSRELMNTKGVREGFKVELLEGDNNWPVVMEAVREINHQGGWLTAEVSGGDQTHLKKISSQMDKIIAYL